MITRTSGHVRSLTTPEVQESLTRNHLWNRVYWSLCFHFFYIYIKNLVSSSKFREDWRVVYPDGWYCYLPLRNLWTFLTFVIFKKFLCLQKKRMKYRKTNNVGNKFPYTGRSKWVTVHLLGSFELSENFEENLHEITSVTLRCEDAFDRDWKNGIYSLAEKLGFRVSGCL